MTNPYESPMSASTSAEDLPWWKIRFVRPTREYVGGIIGGFGVGMAVHHYLAIRGYSFPVILVMGLCVWIGGEIAYRAQRQKSRASSATDDRASRIDSS